MPDWTAPALATVKIYVITKLNTLLEKLKVKNLVTPEISSIANLHIDVPYIFSNSTVNCKRWG